MWTLELVLLVRSTCWTADQNAHVCKLLGHSRPALLTPSVQLAPMGTDILCLLRALRSRQTVSIAIFRFIWMDSDFLVCFVSRSNIAYMALFIFVHAVVYIRRSLVFIPCCLRCLFYLGLYPPIFHELLSEGRAFMAQLPVIICEGENNCVVIRPLFLL